MFNNTGKIVWLAGAAALLAGAVLATAAHADVRTYRVNANSTRSINLSLCSQAVRVVARGDGDTDVDFDLYSPGGRNIFYDYDDTDIMFTTVRRGSGGCSDYTLVMENLGDVFNNVTVSLQEAR